MNKSFNPKRYLGKKKVYIAVAGHTGVSKVYLWSDKLQSYQLPRRGKCYVAKRYEYDSTGEKRRVGKFFETLDSALKWKNFAPGDFYEMPLRAVTLETLAELKGDASCELIFHNRGRVWTYRQVQYAYNRAFKAAGLPYSSTHVCRHTGATQFLNVTNGDYLALQQMGNWSDLQQALHYGRTLKDRARKAVEKADEKDNVVYLQKAK